MGAIEIIQGQKVTETVIIYCFLIIVIVVVAKRLYTGTNSLQTMLCSHLTFLKRKIIVYL